MSTGRLSLAAVQQHVCSATSRATSRLPRRSAANRNGTNNQQSCGGTASSRAISNIATNNMAANNSATNMFVPMFCASGVPAFRVRFQGTPRAVQMSGRASHSRCVTMLPEPPNPNLINSNWTSFEPPPPHRITPRDLKNLVPIQKKSSQRFVRVSSMFFLCCSSSFLLCSCCSMFLYCFLILHFYLHFSTCCFQHDFIFIGQVSASRGGHFRK